MQTSKSAFELYWDDIKGGSLNGHGRIPALSDEQVNICLAIAKTITSRFHEPALPQFKYETREDLQFWSKAVTQTGINPEVFDEYVANIMYAYEEIEAAGEN